MSLLSVSPVLDKILGLNDNSVFLNTPSLAFSHLFNAILAQVGFRITSSSTSSDSPTKYKHNNSSLDFTLQTVQVSTNVFVYAVILPSNTILNLQLTFSDYLNDSLPNTPITTPDDLKSKVFKNEEVIKQLIEKFKVEVVQKWIPGLYKEGYEETSTRSESGTQTNTNNETFPPPTRFDPLRDYSRPSNDFYRPPMGNPFSIGDADLDPFAASPGLLPPSRFPQGLPQGGGMYVGPNHPMFGSGSSIPYAPVRPPFGMLPPGSVPTGARFDPITPFGGGGIRPGSGRFGGNQGGHFSGDPDNDELPPPGMYY